MSDYHRARLVGRDRVIGGAVYLDGEKLKGVRSVDLEAGVGQRGNISPWILRLEMIVELEDPSPSQELPGDIY